jgi:hypothetical protein
MIDETWLMTSGEREGENEREGERYIAEGSHVAVAPQEIRGEEGEEGEERDKTGESSIHHNTRLTTLITRISPSPLDL